jgi:hypothetical protein
MEENSKITESLQQYQLKLASLEKAAKQVSANDTLKMDELSNKNKELNAEIR